MVREGNEREWNGGKMVEKGRERGGGRDEGVEGGEERGLMWCGEQHLRLQSLLSFSVQLSS